MLLNKEKTMSESGNKEVNYVPYIIGAVIILIGGFAYLHFNHKSLVISNKGVSISSPKLIPVVPNLPVTPVILLPVVKNVLPPVVTASGNKGIFIKGSSNGG
jgi:hypothetical protein